MLGAALLFISTVFTHESSYCYYGGYFKQQMQ